MTDHATPSFHPLRGRAVEPLTDDSVAITFAVPAELRDDYALRPRPAPDGPHRARRRRRAPQLLDLLAAVAPGCCGSAVKRLPGGAFSEHALDVLRLGDVLDVMTPTGRFFTELDPAHRKHYVCVAAGLGHHADAVDRGERCSRPSRGSSVTLVYANRTHRR